MPARRRAESNAAVNLNHVRRHFTASERSRVMVLSRRTTIFSVILGALALVPTSASAQQEDRRREFQERFQTMMKEQLGTTDEEWKVLAPKIEKVQTAQRNSRGGGGFGGFGGRGGGGGRGGDRDRGGDTENQTPVSK